MSKNNYKYTPKEEAFCQAYVRLSNQFEAYKESYNAENMKDETIRVKACQMLKTHKIKTRVNQIRISVEKRNMITIDELIVDLANMVRFDPADMYDENGALKSIHDMPKPVRQMLHGMDVSEIYDWIDGDKINIGQLKKVKLYNKLDSIEKLLKHFGAYEKHNKQKTGEVVMFQLPSNGRDTEKEFDESDELF